LGGIDCGHRHIDVHRLVQTIGESDRFIAVRGDAKVDRKQRWKHSEITENQNTGEKYDEVHEEYHLAVDMFKEEIASRQAGDPQSLGGWLVTADTLRLGQEYLRQVVNEARVEVKKPSGDIEKAWKPRTRSIGVDYWDCEVYAMACAEMMVFKKFRQFGWDAKQWKAMISAKPPRVDRQGVPGR